jgi:colanic acid biosynthesis glycosyl transferase WcaI
MGRSPPLEAEAFMRLGFISQYFDPEPASVFSLDFVKGLQTRGFDIEGVLTSFPAYPGGQIYAGWKQQWKQTTLVEGVKVIRVPQWPSHSPSIARRFVTYGSFAASSTTQARALRKSDAIYVYQPPTSAIVPAIVNPFILHKPVVLHVQDLWPDALTAVRAGQPPSRAFDIATQAISRFCSASYKRADLILAITESYKMKLAERGVPEDKIQVLYNWANERYFFPSEREGPSPFPIEKGRKVILFAGNAGPAQGLDVICRAVQQTSNRHPVSLVLVGAGTEMPRLRSEFGARGTNVHFMPSVPRAEMARLYSWTDFSLVALAHHELMEPTLPSKFQSSLASGVPVFSVGSGELHRLGTDPRAGFGVRGGNQAVIESALEAIATVGAERMAQMRRNAREFYLDHFSSSSALDVLQRRLYSLNR